MASAVDHRLFRRSASISKADADLANATANTNQGRNSLAVREIAVESFDELMLRNAQIEGVQEAWMTLVQSAGSREAAGEAIYAAIFDAVPSLHSFFQTPRAIQSMKFMDGLNQLVSGLNDPTALMVLVETLAFGHLNLDVTVPRVVLFRDAILDLFQVELGARFSTAAYTGWQALLNYAGGAMIYIKSLYADHIRLLGQSWAIVNDSGTGKKSSTTRAMNEKQRAEIAEEGDRRKGEASAPQNQLLAQNVPTTFKEMFQFSAAVMGYGLNVWMNEVLACFDNIVTNISSSQRLVEECDFLVCRISKVVTGKVNLAEFKSCMLATLRSLLPTDWTTEHELAWSWLWESVERILMKNMGMPSKWEKAYAKMLDSIDEATGFQLRRDIYLTFFSLAPAGQDYFKQSNTYLHLIATKVLVMVIDIFRDPARLADDISAVGLRHVGYSIPIEYFAPFASACVQVLQGMTQDQICIDGFQWSIGLLAKSLVRTITEGSTIVMKSVNINTKRSMARSLSIAPRGERAQWMLLIHVGTQNISPFAWAIESGYLESASTMLCDLLTIRADRDMYYYAADDLFARHPNIVQMLLDEAPALVLELLDGLTWRSRLTANGKRRVNYYLKHLLVDGGGGFAENLSWISRAGDTTLVCHPVMIALSDMLWSNIARRPFLIQKAFFSFTLLCFLTSQSIIPRLKAKRGEAYAHERYMIFSIRMFIYGVSMSTNMVHHARTTFKAYQKGHTTKALGYIRVPSYLWNWQESQTFILMFLLLGMLATCPILYCLQDNGGVFLTDICDKSDPIVRPNAFISMLAAFVYFALLIDLAVFNNNVLAFVLVVTSLIGEILLFLLSLTFTILTFSGGISCLIQPIEEFRGIHQACLSFFKLFMRLFSDDGVAAMQGQPDVYAGIFIFLILASIFLFSVLIAQLVAAYSAVYQNMLGFARLKRIRVILDSMPQVPPKRFEAFVASLSFETPIAFNEGDVGFGNGIMATEPASVHPTSVDRIRRFGGTTSPSMQWPEEATEQDASSRFEILERLLKKASSRRGKESARRASSSRENGSGSSSGHSVRGENEEAQDESGLTFREVSS